MVVKFYRFFVILCLGLISVGVVNAQNPQASLKVDKSIVYQKVTGFGGFVNSPQFGYNHMSTAEINKVWGKQSQVGCNIMRLYIPIASTTASPSNPGAWSQSLATAKLAKSLGIIVFASPWSMPAEWKTYNSTSAVYTDANGVKQNIYLAEAHYADYAKYLNDYVTYLRDNGVELDALSIQNEPDWGATYAGCIWTTTQMATFIKNYGRQINCKIIAPESIGMSDGFVNALLPDDVCAGFDIYAGHQYSGIQSGFKQLQAKGKQSWMTEYLINWNENAATPRDFTWSIDAFSFANALNKAMQADVNAWIHYAAKRYYGLLGDGTYATVTGEITKRGYILSHFAKYATGTTRVQDVWTDASNLLSGTSYLSVTGDSIIVMVTNPSNNPYDLTVDLPFYTIGGNHITTSQTKNMAGAALTYAQETCRPKVTVDASSITTLVFRKSNERPASQMGGQAVHYNKIESQSVTNAAFGTGYQLSGKTVTFDNSHKLISANTTASNGYLQLNDQYNQLVFHIETISSPASYTSATTTLYYINDAGVAKSYNYGTVSFNQSGNTDWVLDISRTKLTDGCAGILGVSNSNYTSILTIKFGDVFFRMGSEQAYGFTGIYSNGDSNMLDCLDNSSFTSLDFAGVSGITSNIDWSTSAANKNCIYYVANGVDNTNANVIAGSTCDKLTLFETGGNFYVPYNFAATNASYSRTINGYSMLVLPFESTIPSGVQAYTLQATATEVTGTEILNNVIPANIPVLVKGSGVFTFIGSGSVSTPHFLKVNDWRGVYIAEKAPAGSFQININSMVTFDKVVSGAEPTILPFNAYLVPSFSVSGLSLPLKIDGMTVTKVEQNLRDANGSDNAFYDLMGRRILNPIKGVVYIKGGKKFVY